MARLVLVTGGCRSGKSGYAQRLAESLAGRRTFVATCPVLDDDELRRRILRHQQARAAAGWQTIEEQFDLAGVLADNNGCDVLLIDCLTLWVNNVMYRAEQAGRAVDEDDVAELARQVVAAARARPGTVIFVTNEVGLGIVPDNAAARTFRDLVGRCNQTVAAAADAVTLLCCGIPVSLKGEHKP